jgi:hypothetical protein
MLNMNMVILVWLAILSLLFVIGACFCWKYFSHSKNKNHTTGKGSASNFPKGPNKETDIFSEEQKEYIANSISNAMTKDESLNDKGAVVKVIKDGCYNKDSEIHKSITTLVYKCIESSGNGGKNSTPNEKPNADKTNEEIPAENSAPETPKAKKTFSNVDGQNSYLYLYFEPIGKGRLGYESKSITSKTIFQIKSNPSNPDEGELSICENPSLMKRAIGDTTILQDYCEIQKKSGQSPSRVITITPGKAHKDRDRDWTVDEKSKIEFV